MIVIFLERLCDYVPLLEGVIETSFNEGMRISLNRQSLFIFV